MSSAREAYVSIPLHVALIECDPQDTARILAELRRVGFDVQEHIITDGRTLRGGLPSHLDLILLDDHAVAPESLETLRWIRSQAPAIPVIILASNHDDEAALHYSQHGASDYIVKSELSRLGAAVMRALYTRQLHEELGTARSYLDAAGVIMLALNPDLTVQWLNRAGSKMLGCSLQDVVGQQWLEHFVPPSSQETSARVLQGALEGKIETPVSFEGEVRVCTGEVRAIGWHVTRLTDDNGEVRGILCCGENVSESLRAVALAKQQREFAEALSDIVSVLNSSLELNRVVESILAHIGRVVPHDAANVMLLENGELYVVGHRGYAERGLKAWIESLRWPLKNIPNLQEVAHTQQPLAIPDVDAYEGWLFIPEAEWVRSFACAPILVDGEVAGFLNLDSGTAGFYTQEHAMRLQAFAGHASIAIRNARLYATVQRYAAELERRVVERTAALRESEARYRAIVEDQTELICRFLPDGTLTFANNAYCRFFQVERDNLSTHNFMEFIPATDCTVIEAKLSALSAQHPVASVECRVHAPDQKEARWVLWTLRKIYNEEGLFVEFQGVGQDITDRYEAEEVLRKALAKEIQFSELKTRFVSMVSHEFRNPLAVILTYTDLLSSYYQRLSPSQREKYFNHIRAHVKNMAEMLEDLLLISRAEAHRLDVHVEPVDLSAFLQRIVEEFRTTSGAQRRFAFSSEGDCRISTDPKLWRVIATNLLSNAAKYSPPDSSIEVRLKCTEDDVELQVQDEGIGIPEADQARLFEAFHRASNVGDRPGTGLGLTLVSQCVELLGGTISFRSREGEGSTFNVKTPRVLAVSSYTSRDASEDDD